MAKDKYDTKKIAKMRIAADICSDIFHELGEALKPGVTMMEIDELSIKLSKKKNVIPAFTGIDGYPASICSSVNDAVVHGLPNDYVLQDMDIVGLDFGVKYKGVCSDMSYTYVLGDVSEEIKRLLNVTKKATLAGIAAAIPGNKTGDIGHEMQSIVEKNGFSVVRELVGHGIGYSVHEDPYVPGYGRKGEGETLYRGQTLAIEAIVNQGSPDIFLDSDDNWTFYTEDGMLSALFEHTIVVDEEPEILTAW